MTEGTVTEGTVTEGTVTEGTVTEGISEHFSVPVSIVPPMYDALSSITDAALS